MHRMESLREQAPDVPSRPPVDGRPNTSGAYAS